MIDIKYLSQNPDEALENLRRRDPSINVNLVLELYELKRQAMRDYEQAGSEVRLLQKELNPSKGTHGQEAEMLRQRLREAKKQETSSKTQFDGLETRLRQELLLIPNFIQEDVPVSQVKTESKILKVSGEAPVFGFSARDHLLLSEQLGIIDFKAGAKLAGHGFVAYRGKGAVLEWALIQYMVKKALDSGFELNMVPLLNNTSVLTASGNLPKFADEIYTLGSEELHLVPTAEVSLTSLYAGEVIDSAKLPLRMAAYTPCFRREAGSYGKRDRGLKRLHQFNKVETFSVCRPEQSADEHQLLVDHATSIMDELGLHYRVALLPSCDLAQQSSRTIDIEAWLPTDAVFSEVSSASNCSDYQARRANMRYSDGKSKALVNTLNSSALATPRVMIAVLETYQQEDGSISVPEALRQYTGFDRIASG